MIHTNPHQVANENDLYLHPCHRSDAGYIPRWHVKKGVVEYDPMGVPS